MHVSSSFLSFSSLISHFGAIFCPFSVLGAAAWLGWLGIWAGCVWDGIGSVVSLAWVLPSRLLRESEGDSCGCMFWSRGFWTVCMRDGMGLDGDRDTTERELAAGSCDGMELAYCSGPRPAGLS